MIIQKRGKRKEEKEEEENDAERKENDTYASAIFITIIQFSDKKAAITRILTVAFALVLLCTPSLSFSRSHLLPVCILLDNIKYSLKDFPTSLRVQNHT